MPSPILKSFANKSGKSLADLERYWKEAKKSAKDQGFKEPSDDFYRYVVGIVKKRAGLETKTAENILEIIDSLIKSDKMKREQGD